MRRIWLTLGLGFGAALAVGLSGLAQPASNAAASQAGPPPITAGPPGVPVIQPPPEAGSPAANAAVNEASASEEAETNSVRPKPAAPKPPPPPPPKFARSSTAILQALDKVTAETMRFAAPVGQPIRYKNLVFIVKACETTGLGQPEPQASAYVVIDLAPLGADGYAPPPPKRVFKGWMFASSPALNPFQHPIYDAWLVACTTSPPPA